jgi:hypothetical protein
MFGETLSILEARAMLSGENSPSSWHTGKETAHAGSGGWGDAEVTFTAGFTETLHRGRGKGMGWVAATHVLS